MRYMKLELLVGLNWSISYILEVYDCTYHVNTLSGYLDPGVSITKFTVMLLFTGKFYKLLKLAKFIALNYNLRQKLDELVVELI